MNAFLSAYVQSALWSSTDDNGDPLDLTFSAEDLAPETLDNMRADCSRFQSENEADLEAHAEGYASPSGHSPDKCAGHDFWLTRHNHGVGFWDRGLGVVGARLTVAAHAYKEKYLYVGDDGKLHT